MPIKEIVRELQGKAANLALRMPISWINILAGPPVAVDGRTLDGRTQWFLTLLARSGQLPNMSGIGSPYEPPEAPQVMLDNSESSTADHVAQLMRIIG